MREPSHLSRNTQTLHHPRSTNILTTIVDIGIIPKGARATEISQDRLAIAEFPPFRADVCGGSVVAVYGDIVRPGNVTVFRFVVVANCDPIAVVRIDCARHFAAFVAASIHQRQPISHGLESWCQK